MADETLLIGGMHCASCAGRVEAALRAVPGVAEVQVNFATATATVRRAAGAENGNALLAAVRAIGYEAAWPADDSGEAQVREEDGRQRAQWRRFIFAAVLSLPVAALAMGAHLFPALGHFAHSSAGLWTQLLLTAPVVFWAGREFFTGAWQVLRHGAADMNTLVAAGTFAAFAASAAVTLAPTLIPHTGVYFETAAIIVTFILLGRWLEARARRRASGAIRRLAGLQSKTAWKASGPSPTCGPGILCACGPASGCRSMVRLSRARRTSTKACSPANRSRSRNRPATP
jgi:Cu+-exporting ATPase